MVSGSHCDIGKRQVGTVTVVAVAGTVDSVTAPQLAAAIADAAAASPHAVVVDLGGVDFLSSAGMGVLMAAHADIIPAARFAVVADGPATSRPLRLVGIADVVGLFATLDEALGAVSGGDV
ncbi:STAS domain-containing protein [Mycolicibacterium neoaurum]|uniref:STAS domain-containing protein n=1 Tax=Mycolicibacterium neoaurum TaxID=1795 RepID=UPI002672FA36|nr:STAS domain-containing protein [Mycolicibacterium neoaurum]MDO3401506.1 STAS domain-containing protein [Mycolicibacterium neoaurum]